MTKIKGPSGTVIDVSPQHARGLVRDGFATYVDGDAKKEGEVLEPRTQGESESAQFAVGRRPKHIQQEPAKVADPEPDTEPTVPPAEDKPGARATRDELVDYAVEHKIVADGEELQGKSKDEIRELIEGSN
ncbi:hypothetical protein [Nesterenkonia jeotgali]|uniref:Uncharacterized protein n=1 Tax=Nesterenkonia jeotgali TaxID=317018 RepID=A0A839FTL8_9MICC|nr:hypothetical protein [Nesterenkonia jeotgali]MBA8920434.1 hypothetical protein [Nesterenkonia jeotgali]